MKEYFDVYYGCNGEIIAEASRKDFEGRDALENNILRQMIKNGFIEKKSVLDVRRKIFTLIDGGATALAINDEQGWCVPARRKSESIRGYHNRLHLWTSMFIISKVLYPEDRAQTEDFEWDDQSNLHVYGSLLRDPEELEFFWIHEVEEED